MPAFSKEDTLRLLLGEEVRCVSSNVQIAQYVADERLFIIGFGKPEDAQLAYYPYVDVPPEMVEEFAAAPSQGVWVSAKLVKTKWQFTSGIEGLRRIHRQSAQ